jgi:hypothetical protein
MLHGFWKSDMSYQHVAPKSQEPFLNSRVRITHYLSYWFITRTYLMRFKSLYSMRDQGTGKFIVTEEMLFIFRSFCTQYERKYGVTEILFRLGCRRTCEYHLIVVLWWVVIVVVEQLLYTHLFTPGTSLNVIHANVLPNSLPKKVAEGRGQELCVGVGKHRQFTECMCQDRNSRSPKVATVISL